MYAPLDQTPNQPSIDLAPGSVNIPMSPDLASQKAGQVSWAFDQPYQDTYTTLLNGDESFLRENLAANESNKQTQSIADHVRQNPDSLSPDLLSSLLKPKDPRDIIEKKFASKAVDSLVDASENDDPSEQVQKAAEEDPTGVAADMTESKDIGSWAALVNNALADAHEVAHKQSYLGWLGDLAKSYTSFYPIIKLSGQVPNSNQGIFLGENLANQRRALLDMPYDERKEKFLAIMDQLKKDNPMMAVQFAEGMRGQSSAERAANNFLTTFAASDVVSLGNFAKGLVAPRFNRLVTKRAMNHLTDVIDTMDKNPSVAVPEAAGHTVDAAMQQTINRIIDQESANGITPDRQALEGAMDVMKIDQSLAVQPSDKVALMENDLRDHLRDLTNLHKRIEDIEAGREPPSPDYIPYPSEDPLLNPRVNRRLTSNIGPTEETTMTLSNGMKVTSVRAAKQEGPQRSLTTKHYNEVPGAEFIDTYKDIYNESKAKYAAKQKILEQAQKEETQIPPNTSREVFSKLNEMYDNAKGAFSNAVLRLMRVQSIGNVLANKKVLQSVWDDMKGQIPGLSNNYIQMTLPRLNRTTGKWHIDSIFGKNSGELFSDLTEALNTMHHNGLRVTHIEGKRLEGINEPGEYGVSIGSVGGKYYAYYSRPISEVKNYIRDNVLKTEEGDNINRGLLNQLGITNFARTPDELLSQLESLNRKVAIFAPSTLRDLLTEHVASKVQLARAKLRGKSIPEVFQNLGKGSQFQRMIDDLQLSRDPVTGKPGKSLETVQEVYDYFNRNFGRNPDQIETEAYFAAKIGMAMDYSFRNLGLIKNMSRLGNQEHRVFTLGKDGNEHSNWFVGSLEKEYPKGTDGIAYIGDHIGDFRDVTTVDGFADSKLGKEIIPKIASGEYKLIKLYNVSLRPLKDFNPAIADRRVNYVITKNTETRNLSFQQIPRQPGFHVEYDNPFSLKQARVRPTDLEGKVYNHYEGDSLAFLLTNRAQGEVLGKIMNGVRQLIKDGKETEAEALAKQLPVGWKEMRSWFEESRGPGGVKVPARFDKENDFRVVPKGKTIIQLDDRLEKQYEGLNFRDSTRSGSPDRQFQIEFTGERDAYDVMQMHDEAGNARDPAWKYTPGVPVDGITSMNRALNRIVQSTIMDDVKISGMEAWIKRNEQYLDFRDLGDLMSAPFWHFENIKIKSGVDKSTAARIEAERWTIKQFNGVPSWWDNVLKSAQDRFADEIWGADSKIAKSLATVGKYGVAGLKDGPTFLRYMAFKAGIGMFALPQFFTQLNTFVPIAGIAGYGKAAQGAAAALMHTWTRFNKDPAILQTIDKKLRVFGYKPGEFIEAYEAMKGTGIDYVAGETNSMLGYTKTDGLFKSTAGTILDSGDVFFREGDRMGRYGAWYAAFKEWREANPVGRLTEFDRAKILNRVDMLTGNMTAASKSGLQSGIGAHVTQFLGYQIRMAELMLGSRLSVAQKTKLFGAYWLMYGAPVAIGSVAVFPQFGDMLKEQMESRGYHSFGQSVPSWIYGFANEGLPSAFLKLATGNTYNVGEKFGNPGLDTLRDMFAKDKTILDWFGASGSMVGNYVESLDGYWKWMGSFLRGEDKQYGMTSADFIQPFKNFSSVNKAWQLQMAINTHVWMSKNETPLADKVGAMNAIWLAGTGLNPKDIDTQTIHRLQQDRNDLQEHGSKSFQRNMHRGFQALENKDPQTAKTFFNNATADLNISGIPLHKRSALFKQAGDSYNKTMPERQLWQYFIQSVSPQEYKTSSDIYKYYTGNK